MKPLHVALKQAKQQISMIKDEQLKAQLLGYVDQAIEHQNQSENWALKSYNGNAVSKKEPCVYQFTLNQIDDPSSKDFGKRLEMAVGVHGDDVFHFDYMLQGVSADRSKQLEQLMKLKTQPRKNASQIKALESQLFENPANYVFNGELVDVTFANVGGVKATITKFERTNVKTDGNEQREFLGLATRIGAPERYVPVTETQIKTIVTDKNYNNISVQKEILTEGQLQVNTSHIKKIEIAEDKIIKYTEENVESVFNKKEMRHKFEREGELPKNITDQLNLDMTKYCSEKGKTSKTEKE